jgi:hypothetical protein
MKARGITRYRLVGVGLLLAGVMLLPGRAITEPLELKRGPIPEEELKEIKKPRTKVVPKSMPHVRISGSVTVPDGRGLGGVKIRLYLISDHSRRLVREIETNNAGLYSFGLGAGWSEKMMRLDPKYAHFSLGEHFSPRDYNFQVTNSNIANRDFRYDGPLPDLRPRVRGSDAGFRFRDGMCVFYFGVSNDSVVKAAPFKVRVRYDDRTLGIGDIYKIQSFTSSIDPWSYKTVEVELGPGTAEDEAAGTYESGSGRYEVQSVRVDIEDSVIESNEGNNHGSF